jgi:1-deoxy-D-xylulose-5-phosphate synthase
VGEDGETHHGVFDVGFLRQIPGMTVLCPGSCAELRDMLHWSVKECQGPVAIRYPRGGDGEYHDSAWQGSPDVCCHRTGKDLTLITYGTLVDQAMEASEILARNGIEATVLRLLSVQPLPVKRILENMVKDCPVFVVEEVSGGCGIRDTLAMQLRVAGEKGIVKGIDLGQRFVPHGSTAQLYRHCGIDGESIAKFVLEARQNEN